MIRRQWWWRWWGIPSTRPLMIVFASACSPVSRCCRAFLSFIIGDPEDCIGEIEKYAALGMSHGSFRMMWPGMDLRKGLRNMELFAERVMPHFK